MNDISQNRHSKTIWLFALIIIAPILAVQFPRVLAYIPPVTGLGIGAYLLVIRQRLEFSKPIALICAGFLAFIGASLLWSHNIEDASERVIKLAILFPFFALFLMAAKSIAAQINAEHIYRWVLYVCAAASVFIIGEISLGEPLYRFIREMPMDEKLSTAIYNRGALVVIFMGVAAFLGIQSKDKHAYVPLLIMTAMLFFIQSQTAQLSAALGLLFYLVFPVSRRWAWSGVFCISAAFIIAKPFIVGWVYESYAADLNALPLLSSGFAGHRLETWTFVSGAIHQNWLLGHGLEFTKGYDGFESAKTFGTTGDVLHPHSFILQIWIELGAVGVAAFLGFLGYLMHAVSKLKDIQTQKVALTLLVMMLFAASVSYGLWQGWWLGLMVIVTGMIKIQGDRTVDTA